MAPVIQADGFGTRADGQAASEDGEEAEQRRCLRTE